MLKEIMNRRKFLEKTIKGIMVSIALLIPRLKEKGKDLDRVNYVKIGFGTDIPSTELVIRDYDPATKIATLNWD
jgi:hypothetical protein